MIVSPDADQLLAEILALRAARRERFARDLATIDAAYDRALRRVDRGSTFPLVSTLLVRARAFRRALRRRPR
jgi:hypothetical protein